jgi:hypothetical protein
LFPAKQSKIAAFSKLHSLLCKKVLKGLLYWKTHKMHFKSIWEI